MRTGKIVAFEASQELLQKIDAYVGGIHHRTRSEAVRELIKDGLKARQTAPAKTEMTTDV